MALGFAKQGGRRKWIKTILVVIILFLVILACNLPVRNQQEEAIEGLQIAGRAADGTVRGTYVYPTSLNNSKVNFSVSADGRAIFQVEGAPASEQLIVSVTEENAAGMNWKGLTLDGYGDLNGDEQSLMKKLGSSDLLHGISMIPLEAACQKNEQIDPQQLAALLFPLQMVFKYEVADREPFARELMATLNCNSSGEQPSQVYLTAANPIPVVLGYFPFDAEGAVERPASTLSSSGLAGLLAQPAPVLYSLPAVNAPFMIGPAEFSQIIRDQTGPCNAKCRGACGPDCTLNNCTLTADYLCEVNQNGENTGQISYLHIYDCGLHPACIKHDQCYDDCNQRYGCGSFRAAHCRHGGWNDGMNLPENYYCDKHTVHEERISNVKDWVDGFGPQPIRQVFVYTDEKLGFLDDLENCPLPLKAPVSEQTPEIPIFQYEGTVSASGKQPFDLVNSYVVIEVDGELVSVMIDFTFKMDMKWQHGAAVCTATLNRVYSGQGLLDVPLEITLELDSHQNNLKGSDCAGVETPVISTQILTGTFHEGGRFTGNIRNVWFIDAIQTEP